MVPDLRNWASNAGNLSDEELIRFLEQDQEWALKEIFNRYNRRLLRFSTSLLDDYDVAKDIVQEVFIDLWNRRHSSRIQILSGYLLKAVKFQVLKKIRSERLLDHHLETAQKILHVNETEASINVKELEQILMESMNKLSPRSKEVFFLSRFEYLSNKEISKRLDISPKTVEIHITRALNFLRTSMKNLFLTLCCVLFY